jgi:hypothetical protein
MSNGYDIGNSIQSNHQKFKKYAVPRALSGHAGKLFRRKHQANNNYEANNYLFMTYTMIYRGYDRASTLDLSIIQLINRPTAFTSPTNLSVY